MFYFYENCLTCVWKRGETLKPVLFILLAFVVAIPLLFLVPIGLSRRGKTVALVVSLLLSLLAVTASSIFPLWQVSVLLLLMALAVTYVLDRRFGHLLYAIVEEGDDLFTAEKEAITTETARQQLAPASANLSDRQVGNEQQVIASDDLLPPTLEESDSEARDVERDDWPTEDVLEEKHSEPLLALENDTIPAWTEDDYLPPLSPEEYEALAAPAFPNDKENDDALEWLEKSERLEDFFREENFERTSDHSLEETILPIEPDDPLEEGAFGRTMDHPLEETILPMELDDLLLKEEDTLKRADDHLLEETIPLEPRLAARFAEEKVPPEPVDGLLKADELSEQSPISLDVASMPSELMQTIIDELHMIRQFVGKNEYEQRLLQCMRPSLSDHDYYVFARMLIEHYLFEKEYGKLSSWLIHLRERFSQYPVLLEEIQFLSHIEK